MYNYKFRPVQRIFRLKHIISAIDVVRPKDYYFPGEMHDFWEMVYIADGGVNCTADERVYTLKKGDIIFHKPMEFHRIWSDNHTCPHLQIVSFVAQGSGMDFFAGKVFSIDELAAANVAEINAAFKKVIRLSKQADADPAEYAFYSSKAAFLLEHFLFELYGKKTLHYEHTDRTGRQYEQIVRVLNDHCREPLCIEEVARLCNLSVSNLKRIFHIYSDIGIMKYFTSIKLRRAMQELQAGKSIAGVSDELGFSSPSYFHAVFKKELGMTPKEYLRRGAKNQRI